MIIHKKDVPIITKIFAETQPNGIRHYTTPEGISYPSITTILGHRVKPYLVAWRKRLGDEAADAEMNRCAIRGTAVHEMAERFLNNETDFIKDYDPIHVKEFNQLKMLLTRINNIRYQEVAMWSHTLHTAGRVDCIGECDGELSVIDFKTSNHNKTTDMIEDYYLQCTAYALMWYELTGELIENIVIMMSVENGMMPLIFKENIHKYITELSKRIKEYEKDTNYAVSKTTN